MLDLMRRHAQSWFIKALLGGIVVTFISWGGYNRYAARSNTVAYVNGEALTIPEYERMYFQVVNLYRRQAPNLDDAMLKQLGLRQKVYDEMVQRMLMLQEADRMGLQATEGELRERVGTNPAFQAAGRFDEERYRRLLAANQMTPTQFEEQQRLDITLEKLRRLVTGFAKVSEAEALEQWRYRSEKVALDYAALRSADFVGQVKITEPELKSFYEARKEAFRKPPVIRVGYVTFELASFAQEAAPTEDKVRQEYDLFQSNYRTPKQIKARHILFKVPEGAAQGQERQIEQKLLSVLAEARSGKDFAELAKAYSQDPGSAGKGGELGWFGSGQMVEPFEQAAFALGKGGIGGPVRTQFGYHIIKVEDVHEARQRPFEEVREEIARKLTNERAAELAETKVADAYAKVAKAGSLKGYAQAQGLGYRETDFLANGEHIPGLLGDPGVIAAAFDKQKGEVDSNDKRAAGPVLFQVIDRREAQVPPLEEVAARVRQRMVEQKALETAGAEAARLLAEVRGGADLKAAAARHKGRAGHLEPFARSGAPPEIGPEAARAAFKLTAANPLPGIAYRGAGGYVVIRLTGRQEASAADFAAARGDFMRSLVSMKQQAIFDQWLKGLREEADIKVINKVTEEGS